MPLFAPVTTATTDLEDMFPPIVSLLEGGDVEIGLSFELNGIEVLISHWGPGAQYIACCRRTWVNI